MPLNLPSDKNIDIFKKYDIYKYWQQQQDPYIKGIPVAFFTTPMMNFSATNYNRDTYFSFMQTNYPDLYGSLSAIDPTGSGSYSPSGSPFIKVLSNTFKGLDGKDFSAKTIDIGETFYGYKQTLPGPNIDSVVGDTVNIKFTDQKNMPIINLHKLWMEYIEYVSRGFFVPYDAIREKNEIDFVTTIYYFVLDFDFQTILYFSRYVGAAPILTPLASLTSSIGEGRDIPILSFDYSYSLKQDLTPDILIDFNRIVQNTYVNLRGSTNLSASYTIPNESDYPMSDIENSEYSSPVICKRTNVNSGGLTPKTVFMLKYKK